MTRFVNKRSLAQVGKRVRTRRRSGGRTTPVELEQAVLREGPPGDPRLPDDVLRGIDRIDAELLLSVHHSGAIHDHGVDDDGGPTWQVDRTRR